MHSFLKGYETQHHAQYDHLGFTYELEAMIKVISLSLSLSLQIQVLTVTTFVVIFGACMNILFIVKVKIICLTKWPYMPPTPPQ